MLWSESIDNNDITKLINSVRFYTVWCCDQHYLPYQETCWILMLMLILIAGEIDCTECKREREREGIKCAIAVPYSTCKSIRLDTMRELCDTDTPMRNVSKNYQTKYYVYMRIARCWTHLWCVWLDVNSYRWFFVLHIIIFCDLLLLPASLSVHTTEESSSNSDKVAKDSPNQFAHIWFDMAYRLFTLLAASLHLYRFVLICFFF